MAPTINVSEQVAKGMTQLGIPYTIIRDSNFIDIPTINLKVARQKTQMGKNWFESHKALQKGGTKMLPPLEFTKFLKYTKEHHPDIYENITAVRSPWRSERLDADFKLKDGTLYINSNHVYQGVELTPQTSEILEANTLMEDRTPGISLEKWLANPTKQGLPSNKTKQGDLYFWHPRSDNNSVAGFFADSGRAGLYCGADPSNRYSDLGVRAAKQ